MCGTFERVEVRENMFTTCFFSRDFGWLYLLQMTSPITIQSHHNDTHHAIGPHLTQLSFITSIIITVYY